MAELTKSDTRRTRVFMDYRTRDGVADYGFSIEFQPSAGWRVYIIFRSVGESDDESLSWPYQAIDDNGRRYVDWPAKLESLEDAKTVAGLWAEAAQASPGNANSKRPAAGGTGVSDLAG